MGSLDRQVRSQIVTTRGKVLGHNYSDRTDEDLTQGLFTGGAGFSDLYKMLGLNMTAGGTTTPYPDKTNVIRVLYPHYGQLAEAYLEFICAGPASVRFAIGQFNKISLGGGLVKNDVTSRVTSYSNEYVEKYHRLITGDVAPLASVGGVIAARNLNLTRAIEYWVANDRGSDEYDNEAVIGIVVDFNAKPTGSTFKLQQFKVTFGVTGIM